MYSVSTVDTQKKSGLIAFSKCSESPFSSKGFNNWKKALEKLVNHEMSHAHNEAKLQFYASDRSSIHEQINHEAKQEQIRMWQGLLKQIAAMKFLIRPW